MSADNPVSSERNPVGGQPLLGSSAHDLPRVEHPQAGRFRVAIAALVGLAVAAVAVAVVVATGNSGRATGLRSAHWSSWTPSSSGSTGVAEIAQHVAPYYRLSSAQQLDVATPIELAQATAAGTTTGRGLTVAVNESPSGQSQSLGLLNGKTIAYNVCGLGAKNCEVGGTPSIQRMLLLRREALELALYTLEYINGSQNVVVVLPPGHTVTSSGTSSTGVTVALLFLRRALQPLLDVPLSRSLAQYPPAVSQLALWSKSPEAGLVDQVTAHWLFASQVQPQQVGGSLLVLTPLPAQ